MGLGGFLIYVIEFPVRNTGADTGFFQGGQRREFVKYPTPIECKNATTKKFQGGCAVRPPPPPLESAKGEIHKIQLGNTYQ